MKITIFGTWYVGLVTGTCLAEVGHEVLCVDIDEQKITDLENGIIPIYEPWLEELVIRNYKNKRLSFSTDAKKWVEFADAIFSAVGTPPDKNHKADLQYVKAVAKTFGQYADTYKVFINKSTVPVGTGKMCKDIIQTELEKRKINVIPAKAGIDKKDKVPLHSDWFLPSQEWQSQSHHPFFDIVSNPEFLREWTAVKDFMVPDRIVCGTESLRAKEIMQQIYEPFTRSYCNIIWTDIASAEISKYAANSFLATKLSFINEIANFAELSGGNILDIAKIIGADARISPKFLHAGIGYGGSCFPKDVNALIETGKEYGYNFQVIKSTEDVNEKQKTILVEKLVTHTPDLTQKTITLWGLSFKPKTDDIRDAPSLEIIKKLLELWVEKIQCYDPVSMPHAQKIFEQESKVIFCETSYEALKGSDALLLVTEWDEFRWVDFERVKEEMSGNIVIDGRNIWDKKIEDYGFTYTSIGR